MTAPLSWRAGGTADAALLEVNGLRVRYGDVLALSDVSLRVPEGGIVALVGGNGNGKSTTLRAVAGLNPAEAGEILFRGQPIEALAAHRRVPLGLSLVPEGRRLFPRLSVRRNLELGAFTRTDTAGIADDVDRMFTDFPILAERAAQAAGTMSGGEQQMLAIARGLMARPRLLMLDEPSWGIAPKFVSRVMDVIQQIAARGVAVLLVEQNLHKTLAIAHHAYVIQTGRIVLEGSGPELLRDERVRQAYLGV